MSERFIYERGDILDWADKVDVIGHQVNCFGVMGGGLALQIANKWPIVLKNYQDFIADVLTRSPRSALLGLCPIVFTGEGRIANIFGQYDVGAGLQTDYNALRKAFKSLKNLMNTLQWTKLALPVNLGCGLAGGNWNIVKVIIEQVFEDSDIQIILVEYCP